jgi:hypothetical protein
MAQKDLVDAAGDALQHGFLPRNSAAPEDTMKAAHLLYSLGNGG